MEEIIEKYMRIAFEEAEISKKNGENPFGAVLLDPEYNFCHKSQTKQKHIVGKILLKEGMSIFNNFEFISQDNGADNDHHKSRREGQFWKIEILQKNK